MLYKCPRDGTENKMAWKKWRLAEETELEECHHLCTVATVLEVRRQEAVAEAFSSSCPYKPLVRRLPVQETCQLSGQVG